MSTAPAKTTIQQWGMISLGSGVVALLVLTGGCLLGVSYLSLPVAVFGLVAAEFEVQRARRGEVVEMSQATMGVVFSTVTLGVHLVMTMAGILLFVGYILVFYAAFMFA